MSTINLLLNQAWVARLGWTLVHFLWQGTLIAVLFTAVRGLAGRWLTDRGRYVLACLTLGIMMSTPLLTYLAAGSLGTVAVPAPVWRISGGNVWERALPWLVVTWLGGVGVFSARLIGGWRLTLRLRSVAVGPAPEEWQQTLEELIHRLRVSAPVRLLVSSLVAVPTVVGWLRPVVLVPVEMLTGLPMEQIRALLAHELAHIRRHDYLVNIVQSIAEAVLFYHPAVWWVSDQIRTERELCCDDLAVATSGDVLVYASALADLDSRRRARLNAVLAADGGSLVNRIRRLVGQSQPLSHTLPGPGAAWALALLWVAGIGAVTMHGSPDSRIPPRNFVPPAYGLAKRVSATPMLLEPPAFRLPAAAPALTALLFDPFFQQPQAQNAAADAEQKFGRVSGTVSSTTGKPVVGATATLTPVSAAGGVSGQVVMTGGMAISVGGSSGTANRPMSARSDDAGKFAIEDVPPGSYRLSATKVGYITGSYGARAAGASGPPITLAEGASMNNLEIKLTPYGIISGRVTDQDGEPVPHGWIKTLVATYWHGHRVQSFRRMVRSDSLGNYVFGDVLPGRYYVSADVFGQSPGLEPGMGDLTTYYPSAIDATGATALELPAGGRVEHIDIRVRRDRVYSATVKLTLNGALLKSAINVLVTPPGGRPSWQATAKEGVFRLTNEPAGTFTVEYLSGSTLPLSGKLEITFKDSDLDGLVLALEEGIAIGGVLRLEGADWKDHFGRASAASPGALPAQTTQTTSTARPIVILTPEEQGTAAYSSTAGAPMQPAMADDEGQFKVVAGKGAYLLRVLGLPGEAYIRSVRYGPQDATHEPLRIGAAGSLLEVDISLKGASVSGAVVKDNGEPETGIPVAAWPKTPDFGSASRGVKSASTDSNGRFRISGLPPGEYYVAAWEEIDSGLLQDIDFLGRFTARAEAVSLAEGKQGSANLKLISKDAVTKEAAKLP